MLAGRIDRLDDAIKASYGDSWSLKTTTSGALYMINDAAEAPTFSLFTAGLSKFFTDLAGTPRALTTDDRGQVVSQTAICLSDTADIASMVARNVDVLRTEAKDRPTLVAGHSAGGAVSRAVAGTHPELVDCLMDFASVGNATHLDDAFWRFVSKCLVAFGEGDTLSSRVQTGIAKATRVSIEEGDQWLRTVFGPPLTTLNGAVRGAELVMSAFNGPDAYKNVVRAIHRFSREKGVDDVGLHAMAWFCSSLRVTEQMQAIGFNREQGKGPISIPVHPMRDWVCTGNMYRDAMQAMRSPVGLQIPGLSHEFELDHPSVAPFVRTVRDFLPEVRCGVPTEALINRLETARCEISKGVVITTPGVTAEPRGLEPRFGLLPSA